jgi:hypothetical protein
MPDKPDRLSEEQFTYQVTRGAVLISWRGRQVKALRGPAAERLASELASADARGAQLLLAKATGNFKRGNER